MNREPADSRHWEHFMEFAIPPTEPDFFTGRQALTMSEMALQLGITKQQLTKLINDLEEKNLVRRQHSSRNRRHVYLMITPEGASIMKQLEEAMLECTVSRPSSYNQEELAELDDCLIRLSSLLEKFGVRI